MISSLPSSMVTSKEALIGQDKTCSLLELMAPSRPDLTSWYTKIFCDLSIYSTEGKLQCYNIHYRERCGSNYRTIYGKELYRDVTDSLRWIGLYQNKAKLSPETVLGVDTTCLQHVWKRSETVRPLKSNKLQFHVVKTNYKMFSARIVSQYNPCFTLFSSTLWQWHHAKAKFNWGRLRTNPK